MQADDSHLTVGPAYLVEVHHNWCAVESGTQCFSELVSERHKLVDRSFNGSLHALFVWQDMQTPVDATHQPLNDPFI